MSQHDENAPQQPWQPPQQDWQPPQWQPPQAPHQQAPHQQQAPQVQPQFAQPVTRRDARDTGDRASRPLGPSGAPIAAPGLSSQARTFDPAVGRPNGDGAPKTGSSAGLAVGLIAIGVLIIIGLVAAVAWLLWPKGTDSDTSASASHESSQVTANSDAGTAQSQDAEHVTPQQVHDDLSEMSTLYGAGPDSILFETIEETQQHVFNAAAFQYALADSASAALFMPEDDQDALHQLLSDAEGYRQRLLAGDPIGVDVDITGTDGRRFVYDGDTGETIYE